MIEVPSARLAPVLPAQPRANPQAFGVGAAMQALGGAAFEATARIDAAERETELRAARVAAAEALGGLRATFDAEGDWTALTARFDAAASEAQAPIAEGLSPRARAEFDLVWREMAAPHRVALMGREADGRRDHERARLGSAVTGMVALSAAAADDAAAGALADQTADMIADAQAAGWITAQEAERMLRGAADSTAEALAIRLLREDPAALTARLDAGGFAQLDPARRERWRTQAAAETARRAEAEAQAAAQAERRRLGELRLEAEDAVRLLESGLTPQNLEGLRARAEGTPYAQAIDTAFAASRGAGGLFALMPPAEQARALEQFRRMPAAAGDERVLAAMERVHAATIRSVDEDLLGHAAKRGLAEIAPLDLSDPDSARARVAEAEMLAAEWAPGAPLRYLTAAERAGWSRRIAESGPDDQLALAVAIVDGFGDRAPAVLGEMGVEQPTFAYAGSLVALTGEDAAARAILAGQRLLDAREGAKPKAAIRDGVIAELVAGVTAGSDEMRRLALAAADAHFADVGARVDPTNEEAVRAAYADSVQAALGGVRRGGRLFGGVQEVNDRPTILPASLTGDTAGRMLGAATPAQLAAASLGGAPTWGDGSPLKDGDLDDAQAVFVGAGRWLIGRDVDGRFMPLADPTAPDGFFGVDLGRLAQVAPPPGGALQRIGAGVRRAFGGAP